MSKDFTVTITDPERAAEWQAVLGTTTVHVQSPIPTCANLPGKPGALVYFLDLDFLTPQQRVALVDHLAKKFGIDAADVRQLLPGMGVPILAENCVVTVANPQRWF